MLTVEQIMSAQKANVETLFGLTHKAFAGVEKTNGTEHHCIQSRLG